MLVVGPGNPLVRHAAGREDTGRLGRQGLHVGVLDLPAARHLLDDELGVHPDVDEGVRVQAPGRAQPGEQAAVLCDVVGDDPEVLGGLHQGLPRRRVPHHRAVARGPRVAP